VADADVERFKWAMLRVAVDDVWNTGMAWSDAIDGLPDRTQAEIDRIVRNSLLDLLESGYIFFFRAKSFDDEFAPRTEADGLDKAEVVAAFDQGDLQEPGLIGLSYCATAAGREHFATLPEKASRLFPARDSRATDPPKRPSRAVRLSSD
jgi:hypothetical protein